jgi:outer membrane biosynthesis protein TonB
MGKRMTGSVLLLTTLAFSLIVGDVLVRAAQDPPAPPSNPQTQPQTQPAQEKPNKPRSSKKKARGQVTTATTTGDQATTPAETTTPAQPTTPAQTVAPAQNSAPTEQTDLSGTYTGTFNCDALGLTGDTTLTITGNQFTTADGKTGRIVASTTRGYTAVALQAGDVGTGPTATAPTIVSLRARKSGNRLTLMPAAGSQMQCSFGPSRNVAKTRRSRQMPAAGTEVASPAEAGPTPADVTAPAKPGRTRRGSKRAGSTTTPATMPNPTQPTPETPTPSQTPEPSPTPSATPSPTPEPTPNPSPAPTPSATPRPSPTPSGSPTPEPGPTATPSPTPSPSPSPNPGRPRG